MKRNRIEKKNIIACSALALSAIFAGVPAATAFAEEDVVAAEAVSAKELEALRLKKEEAQAAYDAALNDKLLAEDVVENARRAVNDAQEEYDRILEQYSTGFAGFLRWVMETETDPVKVEDARQVLEASFEDGTIVDLDDPADLTRMLYMADWLAELSDYFREELGWEMETSHAVMRLSQCGLGEYNEHFMGVNDESDYKNEELISLVRKAGTFKGMWYTDTDALAPLSSIDGQIFYDTNGFSDQADGLEYYASSLYKMINSYSDMFSTQVMDNDIGVSDNPVCVFLLSTPFVDYSLSSGNDLYEEESAYFEDGAYFLDEPYEYTGEYIPYAITSEGSFPIEGDDTSEAKGSEFIQEDDNISENQVLYEEKVTTNQTANKKTPAYTDAGYLRSPEILKEELNNIMNKLEYPLLFQESLVYVMDTAEGITTGEARHISNDHPDHPDTAKGITVGEAIGVDPDTGSNVAMGSFFNGHGTYTVDEYIRVLREYYSIADPTGAKLVLGERNDDLNKASKDLVGAEESLLTAYGRLKGAEKEYEEAVAGLDGQLVVPAEEAEPVVEAAYAGQEAVSAEQADHANVINISQNTAAAEQAVSAGGTFTEPVLSESSLVSEQTGAENETAETYSAKETQQEDTMTANMPDVVAGQITGAVYDSEINEEVTAASVKGSEETDESAEISTEKDKQKNGILAEVISYIFNGGAIALILPAGFKKKKTLKGTGSILQGDF